VHAQLTNNHTVQRCTRTSTTMSSCTVAPGPLLRSAYQGAHAEYFSTTKKGQALRVLGRLAPRRLNLLPPPAAGSPSARVPRAGEIRELKLELNAVDKSKKKDAVKKVIAATTVGKGVSPLFPSVSASLHTPKSYSYAYGRPAVHFTGAG
jgi:hypothetical protein